MKAHTNKPGLNKDNIPESEGMDMRDLSQKLLY